MSCKAIMLRNVAQMDSELEEAMFAYCRVVQQLATSFLTTADPSELDMLIYQVTKLFHLMRASSICTDEILEAVGISLTLLQNAQSLSQESYSESVPPWIITCKFKRPSTVRCFQQPARVFVTSWVLLSTNCKYPWCQFKHYKKEND